MPKAGIYFILVSLLLAPVFAPEIDIAFSRLFFVSGSGFVGQNTFFFDALKQIANTGARLMALSFLTLTCLAFYFKKSVATLNAKAWLFLLVALLVGPGLFANTIFKDNWGRARPRETVLFGGTASFTPALVVSKECQTNCSFVSGDASFGFYLPCLAFVVAPKARRRVFLSLLAAGSLFGIGRIVSGAHFLSDVLFAAVLITFTNSAAYAAIYGQKAIQKLRLSLSGIVVEK